MKKSITLITLLAGAVGVYAQGTLTWADYIGNFGITVYSPQNNPTVQQTGNTSYDLSTVSPAGDTQGAATVYQGVPLGGGNTGTGPTAYGNGALWTIALYGAPGVNNTAGLLANEAAGIAIATGLFNTSGGTGVANAGVNGNDSAGAWVAPTTAIALAGYTGGATLQLAAWYNGGGTLTYALAAAAGDPVGLSPMESIGALGGTGSPPAVNPNLGQSLVAGDGVITSFSLTTPPVITTPEPSTIALGVIGASALLFRRRK